MDTLKLGSLVLSSQNKTALLSSNLTQASQCRVLHFNNEGDCTSRSRELSSLIKQYGLIASQKNYLNYVISNLMLTSITPSILNIFSRFHLHIASTKCIEQCLGNIMFKNFILQNQVSIRSQTYSSVIPCIQVVPHS